MNYVVRAIAVLRSRPGRAGRSGAFRLFLCQVYEHLRVNLYE